MAVFVFISQDGIRKVGLFPLYFIWPHTLVAQGVGLIYSSLSLYKMHRTLICIACWSRIHALLQLPCLFISDIIQSIGFHLVRFSHKYGYFATVFQLHSSLYPLRQIVCRATLWMYTSIPVFHLAFPVLLLTKHCNWPSSHLEFDSHNISEDNCITLQFICSYTGIKTIFYCRWCSSS